MLPVIRLLDYINVVFGRRAQRFEVPPRTRIPTNQVWRDAYWPLRKCVVSVVSCHPVALSRAAINWRIINREESDVRFEGIHFTLVCPKHHIKQPRCLVGFRNLSKCMFQNVGAESFWAEIPERIDNSGILNSNFEPLPGQVGFVAVCSYFGWELYHPFVTPDVTRY